MHFWQRGWSEGLCFFVCLCFLLQGDLWAPESEKNLEQKINTQLFKLCPKECRHQKRHWNFQYDRDHGCRCLDHAEHLQFLEESIHERCAHACDEQEGHVWQGVYDAQLGCVCVSRADDTQRRYKKSSDNPSMPLAWKGPLKGPYTPVE